MPSDVPLPAAISKEARKYIENPLPKEHWSVAPGEIDELRRHERDGCAPYSERARDTYLETVDEIEIGGVTVQTLVPKNYDASNDDRAILYFFGGAYIVGSSFEDLPITASLAHRLGCKVYTAQYRRAPEHPYPAAVDDGYAVYRGLMDRIRPDGLTFLGESAGGNLCLAVALRARESGLPLPAAAVLLSPWCDISKTGDSAFTLEGRDPTLDYDVHLRDAALAYAGGRDLQDPLVSPLYADYEPGFCPTLITTGTRELFLSDCARLSTRMRLAGVDARLHVWEGMWHTFEWYLELPEAQHSLDEIAAFIGLQWEKQLSGS
jgi:acetyl esterase/lipase